MAKSIIMVAMKQRPKPMNHPLEAGRVSTMALIFSVTVPKVCPGSMTGARSSSVDDLYCSGIVSLSFQLLYFSASGFRCPASGRAGARAAFYFLLYATLKGRSSKTPTSSQVGRASCWPDGPFDCAQGRLRPSLHGLLLFQLWVRVSYLC